MPEKNYDFLVVGAGTAGCLAAITAAKRGLSVCVLESKLLKQVGQKVCGDGVAKSVFDQLKPLVGLDYPRGEEVEREISGMRLLSPALDHGVLIKAPGYTINRLRFGQRLLNDAINSGVTVFSDTSVEKPLVENNRVVGVQSSKGDYRAKIVLDASGMASVLRKNTDSGFRFPKLLRQGNHMVCYREIVEVSDKHRLANNLGLVGEEELSNYCVLWFNQKVTPQGYAWFFPEKENVFNVGTGVKRCRLDPKKPYQGVIAPMLGGYNVLDTGRGVLPAGRPFPSMVSDGLMLAGDAASHVNAFDGGGLYFSLLAGYYAGKTASEALEKQDFSEKGLWAYNKEFYGKEALALIQAYALDKTYSKMSNRDIGFVLKKGLFSENELIKMGSGQKVAINTSLLKKGLGFLMKPFLFLKLLRFGYNLEKAKKVFSEYPAVPEGLREWAKKYASSLRYFDRL